MCRMVEILRTCSSCILKPCAYGACPHNIEKEADKIHDIENALGFMPVEIKREEVKYATI